MSGPSGLKMYAVIGDDPPQSFAWLAAPGISYGKIDSGESDAFKMVTYEKLYKLITTVKHVNLGGIWI